MSDYFDRLLGRAAGPALVRPDRPLWTGPSATDKRATEPLADAASSGEDPTRSHPPAERPAVTDGRQSSTDPARTPGSGLGDRNPARPRRGHSLTEAAESTAGDSSDPTFTGPEPPAERSAASPDDAGTAPTAAFDASATGTDRRSGTLSDADRFDPQLATGPAASDDPTHLAAPAAPSTVNDGVAGTGDGEFRADGDPDPGVAIVRSELERIDALLFGAAGLGAPAHHVGKPANSIVAPTPVAASMPDPPSGDRVHIDHLSIEIIGPPATAHHPPRQRAATVSRATAQLGSGPAAWRRP